MLCIEDLYPDKAFYHPGEAATVRVEWANRGPQQFAGHLAISVYALEQAVARAEQALRVDGGSSGIVDVPLELPGDDYRGYGVEVQACDEQGTVVARESTALDVLSAWWLAPRYGFLSDFSPGEPDTAERVSELSKCHVNVVQFYDWMYRHYQLLPPAGQVDFTDALGRCLSLATVRAKIAHCHARNMAALAYGAIYGAEPEFANEHPAWLLYQATGEPCSLDRLFYIMDIRPSSPWTEHLLHEYQQAVGVLGFDGIHMDQYGFPKLAYAPGGEPSLLRLDELFAPLIDRAAVAVQETDPRAQVLFNAVNNWPVEAVARTAQPATYIEVWPPHESFRDLRELIAGARRLNGGRPVILAAYLRPFSDPDVASSDAALAGARLAMASIFANGGYHLLLGERNGLLCDSYYPRYARLGPSRQRVVRRYYDFAVRYENLLCDPHLQDVSTTHTGGVNTELTLGFPRYGPMAHGDSVWTVVRHKPGQYVISLINLTGDSSTDWNAPHPAPVPIQELEVTLNGDLPVSAVYWASPDEPLGRLEALPVQRTSTRLGTRWSVILPRLAYWDLVLVRTEQ